MHDGVAPQVEVEALLADRGRAEDERPERRVEGRRHRLDARLAALVQRLIAEGDREPRAHAVLVEPGRAPVPRGPGDVDAERGRPRLERIGDSTRDAVRRLEPLLLVGRRHVSQPVAQHMGVFVKDGLQVAVDPVAHHVAPVARGGVLLLRRARPPADEGGHLRRVEEAAKG